MDESLVNDIFYSFGIGILKKDVLIIGECQWIRDYLQSLIDKHMISDYKIINYE
jgi:hypothetical protein